MGLDAVSPMANEIFMRGRGLILPQGKEPSRVRVVLPCSSTRVLAAKRLQTSSACSVGHNFSNESNAASCTLWQTFAIYFHLDGTSLRAANQK